MQVSHNGIMPAIGAAFYRRWRGLKCLTSPWKTKKISIAFLKFNDRAIQNGIIIVEQTRCAGEALLVFDK